MINRNDFERYLINHYNCVSEQRGADVGLIHNGNYATFGNHARREVPTGQARRFLQDLGFEGQEYNDICDEWNIPH